MLKPMTQYFQSLSNSQPTGFGPEVTSPPVAAPVTLSAFDLEVYIDLERFIDVPAELARNEKQRERLIGQITAKEQKLSNESFIARAPQDIVARERESLNELRQQLDTTHATIESLRKRN